MLKAMKNLKRKKIWKILKDLQLISITVKIIVDDLSFVAFSFLDVF